MQVYYFRKNMPEYSGKEVVEILTEFYNINNGLDDVGESIRTEVVKKMMVFVKDKSIESILTALAIAIGAAHGEVLAIEILNSANSMSQEEIE